MVARMKMTYWRSMISGINMVVGSSCIGSSHFFILRNWALCMGSSFIVCINKLKKQRVHCVNEAGPVEMRDALVTQVAGSRDGQQREHVSNSPLTSARFRCLAYATTLMPSPCRLLIAYPVAAPLDLLIATLHNKNIMDLSNDESNFGCVEINDTIPINSHIQEDFMVEDDGMGAEGKRQRTCSKCHNIGHTQRTYPVYVGTKPCTISLECSHVDSLNNVSTNSRSTHDVLISFMLTLRGATAVNDQYLCRIFFNLLLKILINFMVEYREEVAKSEKNHHIVDWFRKANW
ncbi:LOW QUALITY PROTEIN: hypothetical protein Cgig2_030061 [Carnegiea gigantea]|uniref:Uncharacterized protein n=1 Tax=Carnegiea gigantea TaxID=171969 RepID=A0A9Q1K0T1_9CARY|nr:LOW QUALITY PROTEIN: hypothetical protein Cgig2_030061 [Carnegiea gigantea]